MTDQDGRQIHYDLWIDEALRSVMLRALRQVARFGLYDDHHFYISFRTDADNVVMPGYLRARHPGEMTIVLQHQYEDLSVDDEGFSVVLRFNGKPEQLYVPIARVTGFTDPSVNFGLQLCRDTGDVEELELDATADNAGHHTGNREAARSGEVIALDAFRKK